MLLVRMDSGHSRRVECSVQACAHAPIEIEDKRRDFRAPAPKLRER